MFHDYRKQKSKSKSSYKIYNTSERYPMHIINFIPADVTPTEPGDYLLLTSYPGYMVGRALFKDDGEFVGFTRILCALINLEVCTAWAKLPDGKDMNTELANKEGAKN